MMNACFFLLIIFSTLHYQIFSRPTPRQTLGFGGDSPKIISLQLGNIPCAAYAVMAVGNPPVPVQLHVDTGSPLTWVLPTPGSSYDPLKSSAFASRSCDGLKSNFLIPGGAGDIGCKYNILLGDKASYVGNLGLETFTYSTGYWGYNTMENVIFGVGRTEGGIQAGTGSLGLSVGELSIIKSFGEKFSICIGSFKKFNEGKQFLALGDDAFLMGKAIPFMFTTGMHYGVRMTSITIDGENLLNVRSNTDTILDTGTSFIGLVRQAYRPVYNKINQKLIDAGEGGLSLFFQDEGPQCHNGTIPKHLDIGGLDLGFGDVKIHLPITNLFEQVYEDVYCLVVDESPLGINLIGIPAFQGHNIAFDVPNQKIYVKDIDCTVLFEGYDDELSLPRP